MKHFDVVNLEFIRLAAKQKKPHTEKSLKKMNTKALLNLATKNKLKSEGRLRSDIIKSILKKQDKKLKSPTKKKAPAQIKALQKEQEKLQKEREKNKEQAKKNNEKLKKQRQKDKDRKSREKEREKTRKEREKLKVERKKIKEQAKKEKPATKKTPEKKGVPEKPKSTIKSVKEKLKKKKETQKPDMTKTVRVEPKKLHTETGETTDQKQQRVEKTMAPSSTGTGGTEEQFLDQMGDREVPNPSPTADKRSIKIKSLKTTDYSSYKKLFEQWRGPKGVKEDTGEKAVAKPKEKVPHEKTKAEVSAKKPATHADVKKKLQTKKQDVTITNKSQENYNKMRNQIKNNASKVNGSIDILKDIQKPSAANLEETKTNVSLLNNTLRKIKIKGKVNDVSIGPVFSTYHVKFNLNDLSKLKKRDTADKLTLALGKSVRIRINKTRGTADVELQNDKRSTVTFKELVTDNDFVQQAANPKSMPVMLGKDKTGHVITLDLSDPRSPHALIVGQTGAGKSVLLQQAIASVMYGKKPNEAKLILLDPKGGAEFGRYDDSEYLAQPVAKTPRDSVIAVRNTYKDMENRFSKFDKAGVSDINKFNEFVTKNYDEMTAEEKEIYGNLSEEDKQPMPKTIIVADELSDLMGNDIVRKAMIKYTTALGRKARAAGIHMVFATQKPTKRVIPGEIQANLPAKVIMKVDSSSAADYVDTPGAESLLGKGDMIVKGIGDDRRIQSGFLAEVDNVAKEFGGVGRVRKVIPKEKPKLEDKYEPSGEEPEKQDYDAVPDEPDALKSFRQDMQSIRDKLQAQRESVRKLLEQEEIRTQKLLGLGEETETKEQKLEKQREETEGLDEEFAKKREQELTKQRARNKEIDEALAEEEAERSDEAPITEKEQEKPKELEKEKPEELKEQKKPEELKEQKPKEDWEKNIEPVPEIPEEVKAPEIQDQVSTPENVKLHEQTEVESDEVYKKRVDDEITKMIGNIQQEETKPEEAKKPKKSLTQKLRELLSGKRKALNKSISKTASSEYLSEDEFNSFFNSL